MERAHNQVMTNLATVNAELEQAFGPVQDDIDLDIYELNDVDVTVVDDWSGRRLTWRESVRAVLWCAA